MRTINFIISLNMIACLLGCNSEIVILFKEQQEFWIVYVIMISLESSFHWTIEGGLQAIVQMCMVIRE